MSSFGNKNYRKGYNFERRVRLFWESQGAFVIRSGKSRFPDMVVITPDDTLFVECKSSKDVPFDPISLLSSEEYRKALDLVGVYRKAFLLFFKEGRRMSAICVGGDIRPLVKYGLM